MRRHIGDAIFLFVVICLLTGAIKVSISGNAPEPNYEAQANCIAEFDYTHPDAPMMDNLVAALEECR